MKYFKNTELAKMYNVSEKSVRNWISAATEGKLELQLYAYDGRQYIANTTKNTSKIEQLAQNGKKFRNSRGHKVIHPSSKFYDVFDSKQIYDIISNLEIHREIPRQYNYFDGGADRWGEYTDRLAAEDIPNMIATPIKLIDRNLDYVDSVLADYTKVNVLDIGVGNGLPARRILEHLTKRKQLGRYIAVDISPDMLSVAEQNIRKWFGEEIAFEGHTLDINYERFTDLLVNEYTKKESDSTANLVLLLGGTLCNMRSPDGAFRTIHDSMGVNDFLMHTQKLDSQGTRRYFDFSKDPVSPVLAPIHGLVVELLNLDNSLYTIELGFDEAKHERYERLRLNVALTLEFKLGDGQRQVSFNKGDSILVWRSLQQNALDVIHQFDKNGFYPLHISQTENREYIFTISRVKHDASNF